MGDGQFSVEIDAQGPADAGDVASRALQESGKVAAVARVADLGPGLRIRHGLACVDATARGLLASRERVEAELLAEIDALLEQRGKEAS